VSGHAVKNSKASEQMQLLKAELIHLGVPEADLESSNAIRVIDKLALEIRENAPPRWARAFRREAARVIGYRLLRESRGGAEALKWFDSKENTATTRRLRKAGLLGEIKRLSQMITEMLPGG